MDVRSSGGHVVHNDEQGKQRLKQKRKNCMIHEKDQIQDENKATCKTKVKMAAYLCPFSDAWCKGVYPELSVQLTFRPFHMLRTKEQKRHSYFSTQEEKTLEFLIVWLYDIIAANKWNLPSQHDMYTSRTARHSGKITACLFALAEVLRSNKTRTLQDKNRFLFSEILDECISLWRVAF